jgi:RNA-directed DNA polymerase
LNETLPGWIRYFRLARCNETLRHMDSWIRHKLRCYKLKQLKHAYTTAKEFIKHGVPKWQAWIIAKSGKGWWRLSGTPQAHMTWNLKWFDRQNLINMEKLHLSL